MPSAQRVAIAAVRNELFVLTIRVKGLDLTAASQAGTLRAQVRLAPDTPGAPLINLATVTTTAAEGVKLDSVALEDGVPVSALKLRINKTTMSDAAKLPYTGEVGSAARLAIALQMDGATRLFGDFWALASVMDSDSAPAQRPTGGLSMPPLPTSSVTITITNGDVVELVIDGVELAARYATETLGYRNEAADLLEEVEATVASVPALGVPMPEKAYALEDDHGNAAFTISAGGVGELAEAWIDVLNGIAVDELRRRVALRPALRSTVAGCIAYGQSLSLGNGGSRTTGPGDYDADLLMFTTAGTPGPRPSEGTGTTEQNRGALIPYADYLTPSSGNGQTVLGRGGMMIKALLQRENGIASGDPTMVYKLLLSAEGQSNTKIAGLAKGQVPYNRLLSTIEYGVIRAQDGSQNSLGYAADYAVDRIWFLQGEADADSSGGGYTARATYAAALQQLYVDLNTDIKARTGQSHDIKLMLYQMQWYAQTNVQVPLAQLDACDANPNIICIGPLFPYEHLSPTNVHLTGFGYDALGAKFGQVDKRVVIDGATWKCVRPRAITRKNAVLTVDFDVPVPPLVIDTALFEAVANAGFTAVDGSGNDNPVTSVRVVGPTRLVIGLTNAVAGKLRCGFASWGNNLRDSDTTDAMTVRRIALPNACVTFEKDFG